MNLIQLFKFNKTIDEIKGLAVQSPINDPSKDYIRKCYEFLSKEVRIVKNQYELSKKLNKNKYYLGAVLCKSKPAPVQCLGKLVRKLEEISYHNADPNINILITEGKKLINKRIYG